MKIADIKPKSKSQVDALRECIDFLANGYVATVVAEFPKYFFVKLKNWRNANSITVIANLNAYSIYKNSKLVKSAILD